MLGVDEREMDYGLVDERDQERLHFHKGGLARGDGCDEVVRICVGMFGFVPVFLKTPYFLLI